MTSKRNLILLVVAASLVVCGAALAGGLYWGIGSSLGCQVPAEGPAQPGWSARTLPSGGRDRCYHLFVPSHYDPSRPVPLVVSMHGILSNPDSQAWISGWHDLAEREGFLVAYPQGSSFPRRWNAHPDWGVEGIDDVQFVRDLVDDLSAVAAVDGSRVYVNGFSNGGGMSVRVACDAADRVAAIGTVAGAVAGLDECNPSRPVPVIAFYGTADPLVSYKGGDMEAWLLQWAAGVTGVPTYFLGAEEWVALWAEGNGCHAVPEIRPPFGDVQGRRYSGCDQDAEVVLHTIENGGHTWPGGPLIPGMGKTSTDIDATEEMWSFFQAYRLAP